MFSQIMADSSWKTLYNKHISFSQSSGIHLKQIWSLWRLLQQFSEMSEQTHFPILYRYCILYRLTIDMWATPTMKTWKMKTVYSLLIIHSVTAVEMPWSSKTRNSQNFCILQFVMRMLSNFKVHKMNVFLLRTAEQCTNTLWTLQN